MHTRTLLTRRRLVALGALAVLFITPARGLAQEGPLTPWVGEMGITETVEQIMARERLQSALEQARGPIVKPRPNYPDRHGLPQNTLSPPVAQWPAPAIPPTPSAPGLAPSPAPGHGGGTHNPQVPSTSWNGATLAESGFIPPDSTGAVGPTQVLVGANGRLKVYTKAGAVGGLNVSMDTFFNSVRNGSSISDPQVKYDRLSGRYMVTAINLATPSRVVLAVSSGSTITNMASFTFYFFQQDTVAPAGNTGQVADYPKTGVDANAIYVGANMFSTGFVGCTAWCIRKSSVLSGGPIVVTAFRNIVNGAGGAGPFSPMGVDNDDPAGAEGYIIGASNTAFGQLVVRRVSNPAGAPTISANINLTVPTTVNPQTQPALGSTASLDALDDRLFAARMTRKRSTGVATLWTAHNIEVNASGVASGSGNRNGSRWYQIGSLTGTPVLVQSGTLFDSAATNPRGYWIPAVAMTGQGHMVLGASMAGGANQCSIAVAGRLASDTLGSTQAATIAPAGGGAYNVETGTQRWGDYSYTCVDPADDQTAWTFQEYCNSANSWAVRVVKLLAPSPATPASCNPPAALPGQTLNVVVTGTSTGGSAFYDTEAGFNRIAANLSSLDVVVNSVTVNSDTQVTLNITVSPTAGFSVLTVAVTNPDQQTQSSSSGILTIGSPAPGQSFCVGDDTDPFMEACPCGNPGAIGHGCANSVDSQGAQLAASGATNPDTVVLTCSGMPATVSSIFLKGDVDNGAGVIFGDGIRCVDGSLIRMGTENNVGGVAQYPTGAQQAVSVRGGTPPGSGLTGYYQTYYRNSAPAFCPPETFNVSNGWTITW